MKTCKRCHQEQPISAFYRHQQMSDGRLSFCRDCVKARVRTHRAANDHVREADRDRHHTGAKHEQAVAWKRRNPERHQMSQRASLKVCRAISRGEMQRADRCEACGAEGFVEAAHHDYSRPLDVRWLCRRCHRRWDSQEPKTFRQSVPAKAL